MLLVRFDGFKYIARLSYSEKLTVQRAGFLWDEEAQCWATHNVRAAYRLIDYADAETKEHILDQLELKPTQTNHFSLTWPQGHGKKPFQHQIEGVRWVLSRRASYIAFEAGLGKTAIAPLCLNADDGPAIIICPSFLKLNWEDELDQWLSTFHTIQILKTHKDVLNPEADIYIVPDSLLHVHKFREQFFNLGRRFKYIFIDEAHRFKSPTAKRTMSLLGARKVPVSSTKVTWKGFHHIADRVVNLSGTPMPNRPLELYPVINRHAPHALNFLDVHRFGVTYCAGFESEWGWNYLGASNLNDLHHILSRNYMLVKRLSDCVDLPDKLPPKFLFIEDERTFKLREQEMHILENLRVSQIIEHETRKNTAFKERVREKLEETPEMGGFGFISELRKMLGLKKVKPSVDVITQLLEDNEKIVVFTWHKEVATDLCRALQTYEPLKIVGDTPNAQRHKIVKAFQSDSKHRILVANIQSAGVGITLTKSSCVVFVEPSWVPSDNDQAVSRCHRIGQTKQVRTIFLVVKNSLDHLILNAHQNKSEVIHKTIKPKGD